MQKVPYGSPWHRPIAVGTIADDMKRDVNDRDFDVALHLVFKNKAAYDQYEKSERHLKFKQETQDNRKEVRVFDTRTWNL